MAVLKYEDLIAEAEREVQEKGLTFVAKDGKNVVLRPILMLNAEELKVARAVLTTVGDEKSDPFARIEAIDKVLVAAADRKEAMKKSLADLPPQLRARIFERWMKAAQVGEASA